MNSLKQKLNPNLYNNSQKNPPKNVNTNNQLETEQIVNSWKKYIQQTTLHHLEILDVSMVKLWVNFGGLKWQFTQVAGALCIAKDLTLENQPPFLILFEMEEFNSLFKMEIFMDLEKNIQTLNEYFFYFQLPSNNNNIQNNLEQNTNQQQKHFVGFSFASSNQCQNCLNIIKQISPKISSQQQQNNQYLDSKFQPNNDQIDIEQETERLNDISKLTKEEKQIIINAGISKKQLKSDEQIKNIVQKLFQEKKKEKIELIHNQSEIQSQKIGQASAIHKKSTGGFMSILRGQINQDQNNLRQSHISDNSQVVNTNSVLVNNNLKDMARNIKNSQIKNEIAQSNMPQDKSKALLHKQTFQAQPIPQPPGPPPISTIMGNNVPQPPPILNLNKNNSNIRKNSSQKVSPQKNNNNNPNTSQQESLMDQIRNNNIKLKHVQTNKAKPKQEVFSQEEKVDLTAHLVAEIKKRRNVVKKNYMDDDDDEDSEEQSDWDEDSDYDV